MGDDTTEVETAAGIGIVIPDANISYDRSSSDSDALNVPTILIRGLQGSGEIGRQVLGNSTSGRLTPIIRSVLSNIRISKTSYLEYNAE